MALDRFKEIGAKWTPLYNLVQLKCLSCKQEDWFRTDRQQVWCKTCLNKGNMHEIRARELREDPKKIV